MRQESVEFFMTGQQVPAGVYRDLLSGWEVFLDEVSVLPETPEGESALYVRLRRRWRGTNRGAGKPQRFHRLLTRECAA